MAKGISPLRLFMRSTSRKNDLTDASVSGTDSSTATTPGRQPLCPISETLRNPLTPPTERSQPDNSKGEQQTPRAKGKLSFHGAEKYPHLENSEGSVNGTPEKNASSVVPLGPKSKYTWQNHSSNTVASGSKSSPSQARSRIQHEHIPADGGSEVATPRPLKQSASSEVTATSSGLNGNCNAIPQVLPNSARRVSGGSAQTTPKTSATAAGRSGYDSESGVNNQSQHGTPSKSASRSLKYGQQSSTSNGGTAGLANVRSAGSQHVLTRTMGLQPPKAVVAQAADNVFLPQHFDLEEDPSFWNDHNVQVLIRTRPINNSELAAQGSSRCLRQESSHTLTWLGQPESRYTFDHVAGEAITQEKLFKVAGLPMVENCMSGYNSCMFAYGQTGSGKTHTMLGDIEDLDLRPSEQRGITPRVFEYLFARIRREQESRRHEQLRYSCKVSFLEIYNEQITDLLEPSSTNLQLREDAKKGVYVENLSEVEVRSVQDVIQLLLQGAASRKVASTNMNRESSRSHSVFTCVVESKWESNTMTSSRYGRLHLVDLAGSERQKSSGAEGGRLKEAANINKSLSTLGLVIMILVDVANGKQRHVPYRDSKLTFLLQDSLGGNSKTIMIANVSPSSCNAMETLSTLKFAQRAKFIRNNAVINQDASGDVIALRQQIQDLKVEVDRLRRESISRTPSMRFSSLQNGSVEAENSGDNMDVDSHRDSLDASKSKAIVTVDKKLRAIEAVLAGSLRREQVAEDMTKKLASEIEQLNRLVRQREEDSQCSKMMLRFREDKIRRLEGVADNVLSVESFYKEEKKALMEELQLIRARVDRNPELTRFAMENIRLMEQLRRYQEFYDCGEKDILLEEVTGLRNQLLEILDEKLGEEQALERLTTPQKRALIPEIDARARENELLLIEVDSYEKEVKECRDNLNNCLIANAELARQVDQLQAMVAELKVNCAGKQNEVEALKETLSSAAHQEQSESQITIEELRLELQKGEERWSQEARLREQMQEQLQNALQNAENLRADLQSLETWKNELVSAEEVTERLHSTEASLAAAQETASTAQATVKRIRLETEEIALQQRESLTHIQESAMLWRIQESELRTQLREAQDLIAELSERVGADQTTEAVEVRGVVVSEEVAQGPSTLEKHGVGKVSAQERWSKVQELEMRHSEEIMQLQLELESLEAVLKEEQEQRSVAEERIEVLSKQLEEALARVQHEQNIVQALEGQQLFSINELENLQTEHSMLLDSLKQPNVNEERSEVLEQTENTSFQRRGKSAYEPALYGLQKKLEKARREREEVRRANKQFQEERALRIARENEMEVTRSEVETETALAITSMQSEILELREDVAAGAELEAMAKLKILQLEKELEEQQLNVEKLAGEKGHLASKYEAILSGKDAEIRGLHKDWESATAKLIDYLSEGDQALIEASKEMDEIIQDSIAQKSSSAIELENLQRVDKSKVEMLKGVLLQNRLQDAQSLVRETEEKVRALSEAVLAGSCSPEKEPILDSKDGKSMIRESEKKSMAAFVLVEQLLDRIKELKVAKITLGTQNQEAQIAVAEKEIEIASLQEKLEEYRSHKEMLADQYRSLVEGHEKLAQEHELAVRDNDSLKSQFQVLEVKYARSQVLIGQVEELLLKAELQVSEVESKALKVVSHAVSSRETWMVESDYFINSVKEGLENALDAVSHFEASAESLESAEESLHVSLSKVRALEEDFASQTSVLESLESKLSSVTTALKLRDRELECAHLDHEACQQALDKEIAKSQKWADEKATLILEQEQTEHECLEHEKLVESLRLEVLSLESNLKQAEFRVSEMAKGIEALTVAKEELEAERIKLVCASVEAEKACNDKEQALIQIQGDLARVQARVSEAEMRERSISLRMEELMEAKRVWECEQATAEQEVQDMRVKKEMLQLDLKLLNAEVHEREEAVFDGFTRSRQVFEEADRRMTALHEELGDLETARGLLEDDVEMLESAASCNIQTLKDKEEELTLLQNKFGQTQLQAFTLQKAYEEFLLEKNNFLNEKEILEKEMNVLKAKLEASETQLREQPHVAELRLSATEKEMSSMMETVESLSVRKAELEKELEDVHEELLVAMSKVEQQQVELDTMKANSELLESKCVEADEKVAAVQTLLQQYVLSEESWKAEKEGMVEKLNELASMSARMNMKFQDISSEHNEKEIVDGLRATIFEKDSTILSARKEMEIAISNLKEAELEMDKMQGEKDRLAMVYQESVRLNDVISMNLATAEDELSKRQLQIESFEREMQKVGEILSQWEDKMYDAEKEWRKEREELHKEMSAAKLEASEKGREAAIMHQQFQDSQATLMEAEVLVNALVRANEAAKHHAQDSKSEREISLRSIAQAERDQLVTEITNLNNDMEREKNHLLGLCEETVLELSKMLGVVDLVYKEIGDLQEEHEREMIALSGEVHLMKKDLLHGLGSKELRGEIESFCVVFFDQKKSVLEAIQRSASATKDTETCLEARQVEIEELKCKLAASESELENIIRNLESSTAETNAALLSMEQQLEMAKAERSSADRSNDQLDELNQRVIGLEELIDMKNRALKDLEEGFNRQEEEFEAMERESDDVKVQLDASLKENADLNRLVAELEESEVELSDDLERNKEALKVLEEEFEAAEDELEHVKVKLVSSTEENNSLKCRISDLEARVVGLQGANEEKDRDLQVSQEELMREKQVLDATSSQLGDAKLKSEFTERECDMLRSVVAKLEERVVFLEEDTQRQRRAVESFQEERKCEGHVLDSKEVLLEDLKMKFQSSAQENVELKSVVATLEERVVCLQEDIERQCNAVELLEAELKSERQVLDSKVMELEDLKMEVQLSAQENVELKSVVATLEERVFSLEEGAKRYCEAVALLEAELRSECQVLDSKAMEIEELKMTFQSSVLENEKLMSVVTKLEDRVVREEEEAGRLRKAVESLEEELKSEEQMRQSKEAECENMKVKLESSVKQNEELKSVVSELEARVLSLDEETESQRRVVESFQEELETEGHMLDSKALELEDLKFKLGSSVQEKEQWMSLVAELEGKVICLEEDIERQRSAVESFEEELKCERQIVESKETELENVKLKFEDCVQDNEELKFQLIEVKEKALGLERDILEKKATVEDLKEARKCEEQLYTSKEQELEDLKDKLESAVQEIDGLKYRLVVAEDRVVGLEEEKERNKRVVMDLEGELDQEQSRASDQDLWVVHQLHDILKKVDGMSSGAPNASTNQCLGKIEDRNESQLLLTQRLEELHTRIEIFVDESNTMKSQLELLQGTVATLEQNLSQKELFLDTLNANHVAQNCRNLDLLRSEIQTSQGIVATLEQELIQKDHDLKNLKDELVAQNLRHVEVLNVHKHEYDLLRQTLASTMEFLESSISEMPDLSLLFDELNLLRGNIEKRDLLCVFNEFKKSVHDLQQIAEENFLVALAQKQIAQEKGTSLVADIEKLQLRNSALEEELEEKRNALEVLADELMLGEQNSVSTIQNLRNELTAADELQSQSELCIKNLEEERAAQKSRNSEVMNLLKHDYDVLRQTLTSTVEFWESSLSEMPGLSPLLAELNLLRGKVEKRDFLGLFLEFKENVLDLQQLADENFRAALSARDTVQDKDRSLTADLENLQVKNSALEEELDEKRHALDLLAEELMLEAQNSVRTLQNLRNELKAVEDERDKLHTDVVVLTEQLEMVQTLADEREVVAAEARQISEISKSQAEEKEEVANILGKSVEELESTVYALESQLGIVKREAERLRRGREELEKELNAVRKQMQSLRTTIDRKDEQTGRDFLDAKSAKTELDRVVIEMRSQQVQARQSVESLQQECAEKDVQLRSCKAHIAELLQGAEKQASENQQKLKALEAMVDQLKMEERKVLSVVATSSKPADKTTTSKTKGSGSPFKCIGSGLAQQRTSEMDEELAAAKRRIRELESTAASRQKEVFMLNTKLAEAESMTHDVVRDLLGVKMDIASYASLLNQQQVQQIADKARRRTAEAHQKEEELEKLRERLNELITERESWLEEINRRQAECVAARVSAEKLRLRDQTLASENEKLKADCSFLQKKMTELEEEIRKLSGQQNLQQRIHHHAKIKEENNSLRMLNEDLSGKLRRAEILFTRVNDELARYRATDGKTPFLNFDEEDRLRKKLQDSEENRMQLAQNFLSLCTAIMQAAGASRTSRDPDPAAAMDALSHLQDRLEAMERELKDLKLEARIAGEKRRLSDLRDLHSPRRNLCTNFAASQQMHSPVSACR